MKSYLNPRFVELCITFIVYLIVSQASSIADQQPRSLAAIIPLTGNGAEHGEWIKRGLELAQLQLKENGKNIPQIVIEDSRSEAATAITAYKKLTSTKSIVAVFTWGSGVALALSPIVNHDQIVQMGVATSSADYTSPDDFNFRNYPTASQESAFLAEIARNHFKAQEIAIVHTGNDYGTSTANSFGLAFEKLGGKVIAKTELAPGNTDNRAQVLAIRKTNPKIVFLAAYPIEGGAFLRQARQLGIDSPVIASVALFGSYDYLATLGSVANGMTMAAAIPIISADSEFATKYHQLFGEVFGPQHFYSVAAYDAFLAVAAALEKCPETGTDGNCLRENLNSMAPLNGIGGEVKFDKNGDITPTFSAYQVQGGKYVALE